ncbi:MAG: TolC family protein [bacterium]
MRKYFLFLGTWLLIFRCSLLWAEDLGRITLPQAIDLAVKKNVTLKSHEAQVESARARVLVSRSGYFPKITASGGVRKTRILSDTQKEVATFGGLPLTITEEKDVNQGTIGLALSQDIYDFGKRYYTVQQSQSSLKASGESLAMTRRRIIYEVERAFYGYFQSLNLLDVARESVRQFELQLQQAKVRNESGLAPLIDVTTARMNLANARSRLQQAQAEVTMAKATLGTVIGLDPADTYEPVETIRASRPAPVLEDILPLMLRHNPLIRQAKENVRLAQLTLKTVESEYWPTVSGQVNYLAEGDDFPLESRIIFGLQVDVPLASGGSTYYRLKEARSNVQQSEAVLEQTIRDARLTVVEDITNYQKTLSQLDSLKEAGDAAEANLEMASARYQVGLGDIIEWTNASLSLIVTKTDFVNANYSLLIIFAKLKQDVGVDELEPCR